MQTTLVHPYIHTHMHKYSCFVRSLLVHLEFFSPSLVRIDIHIDLRYEHVKYTVRTLSNAMYSIPLHLFHTYNYVSMSKHTQIIQS